MTSASAVLRQILPVVVGREPLGVEPDGALRGLAHLRAGGERDERRGQPVDLAPVDAPRELHAVHDVAPLVGAAHLKAAIGAPRKLQKVVGLEDHVVELQEAQRLLAVETAAHAVEGQHPVDREVGAHVPQERDVAEGVEPVGVVDQKRVAGPVAEGEEAAERAPDAPLVGRDGVFGEQRSAIRRARWGRRSWSCRRPRARSAGAPSSAASAAS